MIISLINAPEACQPAHISWLCNFEFWHIFTFPRRRPIIEIRIGEAPKFLGYEHFTRKWGSRVGSGSLTPNGWISRLGSGTLTPNGGDPASRDSYLLEYQISEVASLANSENGSPKGESLRDHRVSFELTGEVNPNCVEKEIVVGKEAILDLVINKAAESSNGSGSMTEKIENCCKVCTREPINKISGIALEGEGNQCLQLDRNISLGSSRDFNFDNTKQELPDKPTIDCEWWTNEKVAAKEQGSQNKWNFFPMLQPDVS